MKFQKKKILQLIIIVIIIILCIFYLYKYNKNSKDSFTIFTAIYTGEPSATGDYTPTPDTTYKLSYLQAVKSNNICIYGLDINNVINFYSSTDENWNSFNLNIETPEITNPNYDTNNNNKISCSSSTGIEIASSLSVLWIYSDPSNDTNKVDCIYYIELSPDGSIPSDSNIYCLALPLITSRMAPTNTNPTPALPLQPFDNIRLLAANENVLVALGCYDASSPFNMQNNSPPSSNDTGLYYRILVNGSPINNYASGWKSIGLPSFIKRNDVKKIMVNDLYIFIHTKRTPNPDATTLIYNYEIYYIPIVIQNNSIQLSNWIKLTLPKVLTNPNGISFDNLTVNNDVIYCIEQDINIRKTNIWWYPLKDKGIITDSATYKWKLISLGSFSLFDIVLFNNNFIIFGSNDSSNFVIPLIGDYTPSPTLDAEAAKAAADALAAADAEESGGSGGTTTTKPPGGQGGTTTTQPPGGSGGTTTTQPPGGSGGPGSGGSGGSGGTTTTKSPGGSGGSGGTTTTRSNATPIATLNSLLSNLNLNATGNTDNLNDFMANNTLIGSNLYISPMNSTELYIPPSQENRNKKENRNRNITSEFNPIVELG